MIGVGGVYFITTRHTGSPISFASPAASPTTSAPTTPRPTEPAPEPTPTVAPSTAPPTPQGPLGKYRRERENLTPAERRTYGNLRQGDCLNDPGDYPDGALTVACAMPHTHQVMGFVDLSEGMPPRSDGIPFETAVAQRCNSLKATLPIPEGFDQGVSADYPDADEWRIGVRVALCWVPVFHKTWVGSAIDGTAREV